MVAILREGAANLHRRAMNLNTPLWICTKWITGIELMNEGHPRTSWTAYGLVWFLIDCFIMGLSIFLTFDPMEDHSDSFAKTYSFSFAITRWSYAVHVLSSHVGLWCVRTDWPALWRSLQCIYDPQSSDKFRKESNWGLVYIIAIEIFFLTLSPAVRSRPDEDVILQDFINFTITWMNVFPMIGTVLFVIVTNLATNQLRFVNKRLEDLSHSKDPLTVSLKLRQLSLKHVELCKAVQLISKSFGLILISGIAYIFVTFVVGIFIIESNFGHYTTYVVVALFSFFMKSVINLTITCYAADGIPNQTQKILITLSTLRNTPSATLNQQVSDFAAQVHQLSPKINAMGFFHVGLDIFPTLIGTTLTYLIILHQFTYTEGW